MKKLILILLILPILVAGCSKEKEIKEEKKIKIIDQLEREVEISGKIERIVSLWPEATRVLLALGVENKIVGLDSYSKTCPILTRIFPKIKDITDVGSSIGGTLSVEKIAQLKPDIIFMWAYDPEFADKLQKSLGVPVVCVRMHLPKKMISFDMITIIGRCVGKESKAEEIKNYLEQKLLKITSVISKIPDSERPKVYPVDPRDLLKVLARSEYVNLAGGKNLADVGRKNMGYSVSLEDLLYWNPDIIILSGFAKLKPEDILNDPRWQQIKAVKERKVYKLMLGWVGYGPAMSVINIMSAAKVFYPNKFDFDLEKEANEIFKFVYGIENLYTELKNTYRLSDVPHSNPEKPSK